MVKEECENPPIRICEFLPVEFKRRLLSMASIENLTNVGYTQRSAYNAKRLGIISDECCDYLVLVLGRKALPVIKDALNAFIQTVQDLEGEINSKTSGTASNAITNASGGEEEDSDEGVDQEEE